MTMTYKGRSYRFKEDEKGNLIPYQVPPPEEIPPKIIAPYESADKKL